MRSSDGHSLTSQCIFNMTKVGAAIWICAADPLCSTAMDYYNRNCQKMFTGKKCSRRCKNSLDIMLRQKSAAKLATCYCEGTEDFECINIRRNTDVLCFGKNEVVEVIENTVESKPKTSGAPKDRSLIIVIFSFLATCLLTGTVNKSGSRL